jgi:hypothetical protein
MDEATTAPLCAEHPDRPSAGTCARCGRFSCAECFVPASGRCVACEAKADPLRVRRRPFSIGGALEGSFALLRPCLELSALMVVVLSIATTLEVYLVPSPPGTQGVGSPAEVGAAFGLVALRFAVIFVRTVTVGAFLSGVLLAGMSGAALGEPVSFRQAVRAGARAWRRLGWANVQMLILIGLGWVFCLVPGVMAMVNLYVTMPLAFLEPAPAPLEASGELTRGRRWHVLALVGAEVLVLFALGAGRGALVAGLNAWWPQRGQVAGVALTFATTLLVGLAGPWTSALHLAAYYGLKTSQDLEPVLAPAPDPAA